MRIAHPCSENLLSMPRTPGGVHCSRCDRDVVDLRQVPRKRALAILAEERSKDARVCAWVRATPDGTPVFAPEPSRMGRFAPAIVAASLAACASAPTAPASTTPVAMLHPTAPETPTSANTNGTPAAVVVTAPRPDASAGTGGTRGEIQPASNVQPVVELGGEMAF